MLQDLSTILGNLAFSQHDTNAVLDASGPLTYAGLHHWSNALGQQITKKLPSAPQVCLVVAGFDRAAIAGMIGVLKSHHIFVALDHALPPDNIVRVAEELGVAMCLYTPVAKTAVAAAGLTVPTLMISTPPEKPLLNLKPQRDFGRIACYKRSSGSTGDAKTAAYSAEAILIDAREGAMVNDITPGAPYALVSTFDSAMSAAAILRCLLAGGTLMPVDLRFETPSKAARRLIAARMTHLHATPTAYRVLTKGLAQGAIFPDARSVFLSGEKTTMADVQLLARTTQADCKLRVAFSSSETQLVAHSTVVPSQDPGAEEFTELSIFPDVRIDILDPDGTPLPIGQEGRVRVAGKMVALGYQGQVDPAIAAKFGVGDDGLSTYLTDDLGYVTADNRLILTSRQGREVKIRGRRVNLTELETWLNSDPGILSAAAVVQPIGPEDAPRLVAFVECKPDDFAGIPALRDSIRSQLPSSLHPAAIVVKDALPLTPNQKIDRKALTRDLSHLAAAGPEAPLADSRYSDLAAIWEQLLNRKVSREDAHFFDLGGDSIAATVAAVMIEEKFGLRVDTGFVFRWPLLATQAQQLESLSQSQGGLPDRLLVPLTSAGVATLTRADGPAKICVISGAGGHVLPFAPLAEDLLPDYDLFGILHPAILADEPALDTIGDYATRMTRALKAMQPKGPYILMGYSFGGAVAHEIGRQLSAAGEEAGVVIVDLSLQKLDGPMDKARRVQKAFRQWIARTLVAERQEATQDHVTLTQPDRAKSDPVQRAHDAIAFERMSQILERYDPVASTCPTVLIKAADSDKRFAKADYGWGKVAPLLATMTTPGDHLNLFKGPHQSDFAGTLRQALSQITDNRAKAAGKNRLGLHGRAT